MDGAYYFHNDPFADKNANQDTSFNVMSDIGTVLYWRVNSFVHSVSNDQLDEAHFAMGHVNETMQLSNDERTDFV